MCSGGGFAAAQRAVLSIYISLPDESATLRRPCKGHCPSTARHSLRCSRVADPVSRPAAGAGRAANTRRPWPAIACAQRTEDPTDPSRNPQSVAGLPTAAHRSRQSPPRPRPNVGRSRRVVRNRAQRSRETVGDVGGGGGGGGGGQERTAVAHRVPAGARGRPAGDARHRAAPRGRVGRRGADFFAREICARGAQISALRARAGRRQGRTGAQISAPRLAPPPPKSPCAPVGPPRAWAAVHARGERWGREEGRGDSTERLADMSGGVCIAAAGRMRARATREKSRGCCALMIVVRS